MLRCCRNSLLKIYTLYQKVTKVNTIKKKGLNRFDWNIEISDADWNIDIDWNIEFSAADWNIEISDADWLC